MALRNVIKHSDSILRKRSREIKDINGRILALAEDMWETMYDANGVGLAAPQVGVLRRLCVIDVTGMDEPAGADDCGIGGSSDSGDDSGEGGSDSKGGGGSDSGDDSGEGSVSESEGPASEPEPEVVKYLLINPEIVEVSEETLRSREGCLSVPGMVGIVERPVRVRVRAIDIDGNPFEVEGSGMLAKALLHEIDHLNGILYTDIAESVEPIEAPKDEEPEEAYPGQ